MHRDKVTIDQVWPLVRKMSDDEWRRLKEKREHGCIPPAEAPPAWRRHVGVLSDQDAEEMLQVIQDEFRQVDQDEWD